MIIGDVKRNLDLS